MIFKRIFILIVLIAFSCVTFASENQDLTNKEKKARLTELVETLYTYHREGKSKEGLLLADAGLKYSDELQDINSKAQIKYLKTKFYKLENKLDSAIYCILSIDVEKVDNIQKEKINNELGEILLELGSYSAAIPYLKDMVTHEKNIESKFFHLNLLGRSYMELGNYDSTISVFKQQLIIAKKLGNKHLYANALNNIGLTFQEFHQYDSAEVYLSNSIKTIMNIEEKNSGDSVIFLSANNNLGTLYYNLKQYEKAPPLFTYYYETAKQHFSNQTKRAVIGKYLGLSYLRLHEYDKVKRIIEEMRDVDSADSYYLIPLLELEFNYFLSTKQYDKISKVSHETDSLRILIDQKKEMEIKEKISLLGILYFENAKNVANLESVKRKKIEDEAQTIFYIGLLLLVLGAVLISTLTYIYFQKKQKFNIKNDLLESQKQNLEYDLELKKRDLSQVSLDIKQRIEWRKELANKLSELIKMNDDEMREAIKELVLDTKSVLQSRSSIEKFQENIELINESFYHTLLINHPNLSNYDKEFCAYIKLGMSNKEIAIIKNISPDSVRTSKKRVKKRLGLSGEDMDKYLKDI